MQTNIGVIHNGPIFLSALECINNEDSLLDCNSNSAIGISTISCSHKLDAIVRCKGNV